ncbi:hypothetical protein VUR80DRAFT_1966 [Thermomyces stellatus]
MVLAIWSRLRTVSFRSLLSGHRSHAHHGLACPSISVITQFGQTMHLSVFLQSTNKAVRPFVFSNPWVRKYVLHIGGVIPSTSSPSIISFDQSNLYADLLELRRRHVIGSGCRRGGELVFCVSLPFMRPWTAGRTHLYASSYMRVRLAPFVGRGYEEFAYTRESGFYLQFDFDSGMGIGNVYVYNNIWRVNTCRCWITVFLLAQPGLLPGHEVAGHSERESEQRGPRGSRVIRSTN